MKQNFTVLISLCVCLFSCIWSVCSVNAVSDDSALTFLYEDETATTTLLSDLTSEPTRFTTAISDQSNAESKKSSEISFTVSVANQETGEPMNDLEVFIEKRWYDGNAAGSHWDLYTGESEITEAWSTSDANPYTTNLYSQDFERPYDLVIVIKKLPHGYSFRGAETVEYILAIDWITEGNHAIGINLQKEKYADIEFPIIGTYSQTIRFVDAATGETIEDLDCRFVNMTTGEELLSWNTTEQPVVTIDNLKYCFEDWHMKNTIQYAVQFRNMPENYVVLYGKSKEIVYLLYTPYEYESEMTLFEDVIELENTDPESPQVTYITSQLGDTTVSTTTEETTVFADYTDVTTTEETTVFADYTDVTTASETATTSGTEVTLPQTGNNAVKNILFVISGFFLIGTGADAVYSSGILPRKKDEK